MTKDERVPILIKISEKRGEPLEPLFLEWINADEKAFEAFYTRELLLSRVDEVD